MNKKTIVIGASENPSRYSNMAVRKLVANNHTVVAIGLRKAVIGNTPIVEELLPVSDVDTITLYLNAENQKKIYPYILSFETKADHFNPGAENAELYDLAALQGITPINACTLVMLSTNQY